MVTPLASLLILLLPATNIVSNCEKIWKNIKKRGDTKEKGEVLLVPLSWEEKQPGFPDLSWLLLLAVSVDWSMHCSGQGLHGQFLVHTRALLCPLHKLKAITKIQ